MKLNHVDRKFISEFGPSQEMTKKHVFFWSVLGCDGLRFSADHQAAILGKDTFHLSEFRFCLPNGLVGLAARS